MNRIGTARKSFAGVPAKLRRGAGLRLLTMAGVVWSLLGLMTVEARAEGAGEYQIKAAFLYNFAKFVTWPSNGFSDASAPLRICVLGEDPFGQELRNITQDKVVDGHKLQVDHPADLQVAKSCQILFIASSEKAQLKKILQGLVGCAVLTVGDSKGFAEQGGIVNFVMDDNRVRFEVNQKAAAEAKLSISSKLLTIATRVIG